MSIDESNIITIIDEDDNEVSFEHIDTVLHEGEEYVLLLPLEQPDDIGEDEEGVVILRIRRGDEEDVYENVEDEDLLDTVFNRYVESMEADDFDGD